VIRNPRPTERKGDPGSVQEGNGNGTTDERTLLSRALARFLSDGSLTKKASLNAVASTAEQAARILAGLIITPFIVTRLGDALYGTWQVLQRLIGHASPASGRPGEALKWTIAHDQASTDYDRKRRQVGNAVAVWVLFLPVLLVTGGILAWFSPVWIGAPPSSYGTIRLAGAILVVDAVLFALFYLPQSVLQGENLGYKRLGLTVLLVFVSKSMLALAVYLTSGIVAMAVATVAGTVLWGIAYVMIARSRVSWFGIARPSLAEVRGFVRLSWWFLVWNLVMTISLGSDVVVLGIAGSPVLVTTYSLARYLPQAITVAVATLIFAIMPGLGGLIGAGDLRRAVRIRGETMSLVWLFTIAAGATVLLWVESFLRLWVGARYYPGAGAMLMIMLMVLQFSLIRTDANIIDLTLNLRRKVLLGTVSAAIAVALGWFFLAVLDMGIAGLALGFILGRAIQSVTYPLMIGRVLGTPPASQVRAIVRPGLATAALFGLSSAASTVVGVHSWIGLVVVVGLSAAAIAVVAFFAGLPEGPRRIVWKRLRRVARLT
jgi:O-antigen/teichoic acid export membrane protein